MSEKEMEQLKRELEHERQKNQKTTLKEYLYNSHFYLYRNLRLASISRCLTGFTRVEGKYYPKWPRPWHDLENTHRQRHFKAIKTACKGGRLFHQETTTRDIGSAILRKRAGNENAINHFKETTVEDPVWDDEDNLVRE